MQKKPLRPTSLPLALPGPSSSQYDELMDNLSDDEKYNILLQSRASSLVQLLGKKGRGMGGNSRSTSEAFTPLYKLVEEMTDKDMRITLKSFAALIDAASLSRDLNVIQECLLLARRNGVSRAFARSVGTLNPPPPLRAASDRYDLSPVPSDARTSELAAGVAALTVVGGALSVEAVGPLLHADTTAASVVLGGAAVMGVWDLTQRKGQELTLALAGINRLFLRDPERDAHVQAATFLSAYLLGLPCFCFSPNVMEAVRMTAQVPAFAETLSSTAGLNRLLVYLLAPVAVEEANYAQLMASDARQARALLQVFMGRGEARGQEGREEEVLLPWAYEEAKRLLRSHSALLERLKQRMESGGATVGDCVALLEGAVPSV